MLPSKIGAGETHLSSPLLVLKGQGETLLLLLLFARTSGLCASLTVILSTKDRSLCMYVCPPTPFWLKPCLGVFGLIFGF